MGTTIGINTNLLLGCLLFVAFDRSPEFANRYKKYFMVGIPLLNMSLLVFWAALLICGVIKSSDTLNSVPFATMMTHLQPWFVMFTGAGVCIMTVSYTHLDVYKRQFVITVSSAFRSKNL